MIFSAQEAPSSAAGELRQLRRSLNTPVVSIAQLPVGPASAVIAVHESSGDGGLHFTVAVRCEQTRSAVFFAAAGDPGPGGLSLAADAALSLAEGMGFLFDDWIAADHPATRDVAARLWGQFVEAAKADSISRSTGCESVDTCAESPASGISLTKFRRNLPWGASEATAAGPDARLARERGA